MTTITWLLHSGTAWHAAHYIIHRSIARERCPNLVIEKNRDFFQNNNWFLEKPKLTFLIGVQSITWRANLCYLKWLFIAVVNWIRHRIADSRYTVYVPLTRVVGKRLPVTSELPVYFAHIAMWMSVAADFVAYLSKHDFVVYISVLFQRNLETLIHNCMVLTISMKATCFQR